MKKIAKVIQYNEDKTIALCVDVDTWDTIHEYISRTPQHKKKFLFIANVILKRLRNTDVYDKEDINSKCKDVTAMKFFKRGANDRIYCKEQKTEEKLFVVVAAELFEKKKTKGVNQKIKNIIEKVAKNEYEIIE